MSTVAAIQMRATPHLADNLAEAEKWLQRAAAQGAVLAVLPEMFPLSGTSLSAKLAVQEPYGHGVIQDFLANMAQQYRLWIVGGTIPLQSDDPQRVYAASLVFDHNGQVVARYNKIHLFDVTVGDKDFHESKNTCPGRDVVVVKTPVGQLGLSVCYDIRFPELFRLMFNEGAEIFSIPAAFTYPTGLAHWEVLLRARAIENFCYVIGAGQYGINTDPSECYGHSMIISPWGEKLAELEQGGGVVISNIDLDQLRSIRAKMPVGQHQRVMAASKIHSCASSNFDRERVSRDTI